jgi:hypothetical protein
MIKIRQLGLSLRPARRGTARALCPEPLTVVWAQAGRGADEKGQLRRQARARLHKKLQGPADFFRQTADHKGACAAVAKQCFCAVFEAPGPRVFPVSASQARVNPARRAQDHMAPQSLERAGRSLAAQLTPAAAPRMPPSTFAHVASTLTCGANSTWTCQNFAVPSRLTTWNSSSGSSATLTCTLAGTSTMPSSAVAARALSPSRKMTRATSLPPRWLPSRMALFASPRPHPPAAPPPLPTKRQLHQVLCLLCAAVLC